MVLTLRTLPYEFVFFFSPNSLGFCTFFLRILNQDLLLCQSFFFFFPWNDFLGEHGEFWSYGYNSSVVSDLLWTSPQTVWLLLHMWETIIGIKKKSLVWRFSFSKLYWLKKTDKPWTLIKFVVICSSISVGWLKSHSCLQLYYLFLHKETVHRVCLEFLVNHSLSWSFWTFSYLLYGWKTNQPKTLLSEIRDGQWKTSAF